MLKKWCDKSVNFRKVAPINIYKLLNFMSLLEKFGPIRCTCYWNKL